MEPWARYGWWMMALLMGGMGVWAQPGSNPPSPPALPKTAPLPIPVLLEDLRLLEKLRGLRLTAEQISQLLEPLGEIRSEVEQEKEERQKLLGKVQPVLAQVRTAMLQGVPPDPRVAQPAYEAWARLGALRATREKRVAKQLEKIHDLLTEEQRALIEPTSAYYQRLQQEKAAKAVRSKVLEALMEALQQARGLQEAAYASQKERLVQDALRRALGSQATESVLQTWTPLLTPLFDEFRALSDVQFKAQGDEIRWRLHRALWPSMPSSPYVLSEPEFASFWQNPRLLALLREMQNPSSSPTPAEVPLPSPQDPTWLAEQMLEDLDLIPLMDAFQFTLSQLRALPPILRQLQKDLKEVEQKVTDLWRKVYLHLLAKRTALVQGKALPRETQAALQSAQELVEVEEGRKSRMIQETVQQVTTRILTPQQTLLIGVEAMTPAARRALLEEIARARQQDFVEMMRILQILAQLKRRIPYDYRRQVGLAVRDLIAQYLPNLLPGTAEYEMVFRTVLQAFNQAHALSFEEFDLVGPALAYQLMLYLRQLAGIPPGPQLPQQIMTLEEFQEFLIHPRLPTLMEERARYWGGVGGWSPAVGGTSPQR